MTKSNKALTRHLNSMKGEEIDVSKARLAFDQIMDAGLIEDRQEYDVEMLERMYALTRDEANELYMLILHA